MPRIMALVTTSIYPHLLVPSSRKYCFLSAGDFAQSMVDRLLVSSVDEGGVRCNPSALLEEAIMASSCAQDTYAGRVRLSFCGGRRALEMLGPSASFIPLKPRLTISDPLLMAFSPPEPLKPLFYVETSSAYASCFSMLMRIRICLSRLDKTWKLLKDAEYSFDTSLSMLRSLRMWHRQALQFTSALLQHIYGSLGTIWERFKQDMMSRPRDIDQMAVAHSDYLRQVWECAFLT